MLSNLFFYYQLDKRLKELRSERGLKQVDIASRLGVTKQSVANWENGNIMPSIEILVKLSKLFSVSTDYLLGLDDKRFVETTGLSDLQITHIQQIVDDLKEASSPPPLQ